jgi:hypothetical protein
MDKGLVTIYADGTRFAELAESLLNLPAGLWLKEYNSAQGIPSQGERIEIIPDTSDFQTAYESLERIEKALGVFVKIINPKVIMTIQGSLKAEEAHLIQMLCISIAQSMHYTEIATKNEVNNAARKSAVVIVEFDERDLRRADMVDKLREALDQEFDFPIEVIQSS